MSKYYIQPMYQASTVMIVNKADDPAGTVKLDINEVALNIKLIDADAKVLVRLSDGVLLAVRSGKVKSKVLLRVKSDFENVGARILGVILNDAERDRIYGNAAREARN